MKSILKKYFLYLFVCFFYSTLPGHCQTNIPGGTVSGTWVLSASPYTVNGDILIPADSSLVIQAGVKIVFNGQYRLSVFGRVMAEGSASSPVSFTAGNPSTGWMGIRFDGISPLQDSSVFTFCTLQHGIANCSTCTGNNPNDKNGGALLINNFSKIRITNCTFASNQAITAGGAICCIGSAPIITHNIFSGNSTLYGNGGGIYCLGASPIISQNNFVNNSAFYNGMGGGIYCDSSSCIIGSNSFNMNRASGGGGAVACGFGNPQIANNMILHNSVQDVAGGGIYCFGNATITHNVIDSNSVDYSNCSDCGQGAGIFVLNSAPLISWNRINFNQVFSGYGGGIYCNNASPTLSHNSICYNTVSGGGAGGMYAYKGAPALDTDTVRFNTSLTSGYGGGINFTLSSPTLSNCDISYNTCSGNSGSTGGGLCIQSTPQCTISNCTINHNAAHSGGGLTLLGGSCTITGCAFCFDSAIAGVVGGTLGGGGGLYCDGNYIIRNCTIYHNYSGDNGGGMDVLGSASSKIINSVISNNAGQRGGGIYGWSDSSSVIGCLIANDSAWVGGGMYYEEDSHPSFSNCTVVNNIATAPYPISGNNVPGGGAVFCWHNSTPTFVRNSIFWGNIANSGWGPEFLVYVNSCCQMLFANSDIQGGLAQIYGGNYAIYKPSNIDQQPLFVSPSGGAGVSFDGILANWKLQNNSPCIDTGDSTGLQLPAFDLGGSPRVNHIVDIGAYEFPFAAGYGPGITQESNIILYPNPTPGAFTIQASETITSIEIENLMGQQIFHFPYSDDQILRTTDLSEISKGIYVVKVYLKNGLKTIKLFIH